MTTQAPRRAWLDAYRAARKSSGPSSPGFPMPRGWWTDDALRRLGRRSAGLPSIPHRVALFLLCAAEDRRKRRIEAARMYLGMARKANTQTHLCTVAALGA